MELQTEQSTSTYKILSEKTKNLFIQTWSFGKFYLFWIVMHFAVTNLYTWLCTPMTTMGFLWSPFMAVAPHCKGLQWLFNIAVNTIDQMWLIFGVWLTGKFTGLLGGVVVVENSAQRSHTHKYHLRKRNGRE